MIHRLFILSALCFSLISFNHAASASTRMSWEQYVCTVATMTIIYGLAPEEDDENNNGYDPVGDFASWIYTKGASALKYIDESIPQSNSTGRPGSSRSGILGIDDD